MRLTVAPIGIAIGRFELKIKEPGIVRLVAFEAQKKLIMTGGRPDFEERPIIFVEASPDAPLVSRTFVCIKQGEFVTTDEGERAEWRGTGVSGHSGLVVHVFEIRRAA